MVRAEAGRPQRASLTVSDDVFFVNPTLLSGQPRSLSLAVERDIARTARAAKGGISLADVVL
jgi:hypothetical protein